LGSVHDYLMGSMGAPALMEINAKGVLQYRLPSHPEGVEPYQFPGIPSPVRSEIQFTADGEVRRETKTWQIETPLLTAKGILHPQRNAGVEDSDGKWVVDSTACVWGDVFVTLALARAPRTAGNELRSASV
jgi:hypothetical protein